MLRTKVIWAFVTVWCAVCLAYVGVRTVFGAVSGAIVRVDEPAEVSTSDSVSTSTSADTSLPEVEPLAVVEVPDAVAEEVVEEVPEEVIEEPFVEEPTEESVAEYEDTSVPSLFEYLSQFTCGSCRRNCSLANPRCHNGSRLADAKVQEYYDLYGE
jgi:hypothetical protein